jgi:hypothetical protein
VARLAQEKPCEKEIADMPFTISHPAAVLLLTRSGLVPSALVIGSVVPDVLNYVPIPRSSAVTLSLEAHSAAGVFGLDLALGLVVFLLWQILVAPLAVAAAPAAVRVRLAPGLPVPWRAQLAGPRAILLVVVSIYSGAATHVLWDEFTHPNRFGEQNVSWLATAHGSMMGYQWAQYASSVIGAGLIAAWVWRWCVVPVTPQATDLQRVPALPTRALVSVTGAVLGAGLTGVIAGVATGWQAEHSVHEALYRLATWGGGAFLFAILACAVIHALVYPAAEPDRASSPG